MEDLPTHLSPSELGTKTYWDNIYDREIANHASDPSDQGTVWFADSGAEEKVLQYLDDLAEDGTLSKGDSTSGTVDEEATSFLDLGSGNGHLLAELRREGWAGRMLGVDYSAASVALAKQIEEARLSRSGEKNPEDDEDGEDANTCLAPITFRTLDILSPTTTPLPPFHVLLDKGTFDAISLSSDTDASGRRTSEQYRARIKPFLRQGGLFVITSCNWTEEELRKWMEVEGSEEDGKLVFEGRVKYPSFRFGGQEGSTVCTVVFRKC